MLTSVLLQGAERQSENGKEGNGASCKHSKYSPGVIAIAGYDPAVLAIWNLQVQPADDVVCHCMCTVAHSCHVLMVLSKNVCF